MLWIVESMKNTAHKSTSSRFISGYHHDEYDTLLPLWWLLMSFPNTTYKKDDLVCYLTPQFLLFMILARKMHSTYQRLLSYYALITDQQVSSFSSYSYLWSVVSGGEGWANTTSLSSIIMSSSCVHATSLHQPSAWCSSACNGNSTTRVIPKSPQSTGC